MKDNYVLESIHYFNQINRDNFNFRSILSDGGEEFAELPDPNYFDNAESDSEHSDPDEMDALGDWLGQLDQLSQVRIVLHSLNNPFCLSNCK